MKYFNINSTATSTAIVSHIRSAGTFVAIPNGVDRSGRAQLAFVKSADLLVGNNERQFVFALGRDVVAEAVARGNYRLPYSAYRALTKGDDAWRTYAASVGKPFLGFRVTVTYNGDYGPYSREGYRGVENTLKGSLHRPEEAADEMAAAIRTVGDVDRDGLVSVIGHYAFGHYTVEGTDDQNAGARALALAVLRDLDAVAEARRLHDIEAEGRKANRPDAPKEEDRYAVFHGTANEIDWGTPIDDEREAALERKLSRELDSVSTLSAEIGRFIGRWGAWADITQIIGLALTDRARREQTALPTEKEIAAISKRYLRYRNPAMEAYVKDGCEAARMVGDEPTWKEIKKCLEHFYNNPTASRAAEALAAKVESLRGTGEERRVEEEVMGRALMTVTDKYGNSRVVNTGYALSWGIYKRRKLLAWMNNPNRLIPDEPEKAVYSTTLRALSEHRSVGCSDPAPVLGQTRSADFVCIESYIKRLLTALEEWVDPLEALRREFNVGNEDEK